MPLYEYVCEEDGSVLELIRPMDAADDPVEDPEGLGRRFVRRHSTFQAKGGRPESTPLPVGGFCPCGKPASGCGSMRGG